MLLRRSFLKMGTTLAAASGASAAAPAENSDNKVVYHLDDRERSRSRSEIFRTISWPSATVDTSSSRSSS